MPLSVFKKQGVLPGVLLATVAAAGACMPCAVFAQGVAAQTVTPTSASTPAQAQQTAAGKFVQDLGDKAIGIVTNKTLTQAQRDDQYKALLQGAFDLRTIGHFVLGYGWQTASPAQQDQYMKLFQALVVKIYGEKLTLYSGEKFVVKAVRPESDRDTIVSSDVIHADGSAPTQIDWRVRDRDGQLAVIDVSIAGVSQSVTQRSEYAAILQRNNGNLDALLDSMRQQLNGA